MTAYTDLETLKTYHGIESESDDVILQSLINAASAWIDATCHRVFAASANTTRYFDAEKDVEGQTLHLDYDLCAINSVTNGDGTTVSASEYVTEPRNYAPYYALTLKASSTVAWTYSTTPENAIAISGKWAWSVEAPDQIKHACNRLAAWMYRQRDNPADMSNTVRSESGVYLVPSKMPSDVAAMLSPYIRR